jgi:hypothetical protein
MNPPPEIRIGTAEREAAISLLASHFGAGRLTMAEFDARSAAAAKTTTRSEIDALLADLPTSASAQLEEEQRAARGKRWRDTVMKLTPFVALIGFYATAEVWDQAWMWFLGIPIACVLLYTGDDDDDDDDQGGKKKSKKRGRKKNKNKSRALSAAQPQAQIEAARAPEIEVAGIHLAQPHHEEVLRKPPPHSAQ